MAARVLNAVRWLPAVAALGYVYVLVRRLGEVADQVTWNPDYVSVMAIANTIGAHGKTGRAVVIQAGYFWFDLATYRLPFHRWIWEYAPSAMALLALVLLCWTAWRVAGRFAAALTASIGLAASPLVLSTEVAQSYHGTTWFGAALLGAYLCWLLSSKAGRLQTAAVALTVVALAGFATASDPLLGPTGDVPFVVAILLLWRARHRDVAGTKVVAGLASAAGVGLVAGLLVLGGRFAGYGSSFPRGLTHPVTPAHIAGNVRQLVSGIFEVAGAPRGGGSVIGLALGCLLFAGVLLPIMWLIRSIRGPMPAPLLGVIAFWAVSALAVAAGFLFSDVPADFLQNSARYLVPMFFVAVGTVPIWAATGTRRAAAVAVPAAFFILSNAAAVDHNADARLFRPSFIDGLDAAIAFLEQHGLTHGYAAYDEASPISWKTDFGVEIYPITEVLVSPDDSCGSTGSPAVCPFAYDSVSDWYRSGGGPTFILIDPQLYRLTQPPPDSLDKPIAVYNVGRFVIYVYADDVAAHMDLPRRFTRPLL